MFVERRPIDDPDLVAAGAGHFELVCAGCHGSPARPNVAAFSAMLPQPPPLTEEVADWEDAELFWIIRNGLKFTGMPGWIAPERHDEVWALTAFVRRLPEMDAGEYEELTLGNLRGAEGGVAFSIGARALASSCARCHGDADSVPVSTYIPRIAGQRLAYLRRTMEDYASGARASGIMQPIAVAMTADERASAAEHYASRSARRAQGNRPAIASDREQIERGRTIATSGVRPAGIPPCLACHGAESHATFPRLGGQSADYIAGQLRLWQQSLRDETTHGAIMAPIARRLDDGQIEDVATYFEHVDSTTAGAERR
jgi:cytochrome c553